MERYDLICKGKLLAGFSPYSAIGGLQEVLQTDAQGVKDLLTAKPTPLLEGQSWEQVNQLHQRLDTAGLACEIKVILSADILLNNLTEVVEQPKPEVQTQVTTDTSTTDTSATESTFAPEKPQQAIKPKTSSALRTLKVDLDGFRPKLYSGPQDARLVDQKENRHFKLESFNPKINPVFLIILSLAVGLLIEFYFLAVTRVLPFAMPRGFMTFLALVILMAVVVILPTILTTKRLFTLTHATTKKPEVFCQQVFTLSPFVNHYNLYGEGEFEIATVEKNLLTNCVVCFNRRREVVFSSIEESESDELLQGIATEIEDQLFDISVLKYVNFIVSFISKKAKPRAIPIDQDSPQQRFVVRDFNEQKVAYFYENDKSVIELPVDIEYPDQQRAMMAFLMICIGVD